MFLATGRVHGLVTLRDLFWGGGANVLHSVALAVQMFCYVAHMERKFGYLQKLGYFPQELWT